MAAPTQLQIDPATFERCNKQCQVAVQCSANGCVQAPNALPHKRNLLLCIEFPNVVSELSQYMDIKSQHPDTTEAYVI